MKKHLVGMMAILLLAGLATAQNIGIKGGLNVYNIGNEDNTAGDTKLGYHFGLISHIHLASDLAFQPEVTYSTQGAKYGNNLQLDLNYINVPLLLQYMFDNGFRIELGPQVGFLMSANAVNNDVKTDVKDNFKSIEVGVGFGVSYINPESNFGVDARYNHGLTDINETNPIKSYNSGFQVGVFYLFKHK